MLRVGPSQFTIASTAFSSFLLCARLGILALPELVSSFGS